MMPSFPGWLAPLNFSLLRFEEFLSFLLTGKQVLATASSSPATLAVLDAWHIRATLQQCGLLCLQCVAPGWLRQRSLAGTSTTPLQVGMHRLIITCQTCTGSLHCYRLDLASNGRQHMQPCSALGLCRTMNRQLHGGAAEQPPVVPAEGHYRSSKLPAVMRLRGPGVGSSSSRVLVPCDS